MGVPKTPFTLVITYPTDQGSYQIQSKLDEDHRAYGQKINVNKVFNGLGWRIHPDWLYCKNILMSFDTPELELLYSIETLDKIGWKFLDKRAQLYQENHIICKY